MNKRPWAQSDSNPGTIYLIDVNNTILIYTYINTLCFYIFPKIKLSKSGILSN